MLLKTTLMRERMLFLLRCKIIILFNAVCYQKEKWLKLCSLMCHRDFASRVYPINVAGYSFPSSR